MFVESDRRTYDSLHKTYQDERIRLLNNDIFNAKFNCLFDMVIMNFVLEHVGKRSKDLLCLGRDLINAEGRLYLSNWIPVSDQTSSNKEIITINHIIERLKSIRLYVEKHATFSISYFVEEDEFNMWLKSTNQFEQREAAGIKLFGAHSLIIVRREKDHEKN